MALVIGCGGPGAVPGPESINVSPDNAQIDVGETQQFTAEAVFADGSASDITGEVEWSSSNSGVATVDLTGLASGLSDGNSFIIATFEGLTDQGNLQVLVSTATLTGIEVTSPATSIADGLTLQLDATGTYSDGSTRDVGDTCNWTVSNAFAAISNTAGTKGLLTGQAVGAVDATCTIGAVSDSLTINVSTAVLTSITVTPDTNVSVPVGLTQQFTAVGLYSDSATPVDITNTVTWSTTATTIGTVSNAAGTRGLYTAILPGAGNVRASIGAVQDEVTFTVGSAVLVSITISPDPVTLADGLTQQFTCSGMLSNSQPQDCTTLATWSSSNVNVATIGANTGLATTVGNTAIGPTTITAQVGTLSDTAALTVSNAAIQSINVTPEPFTIAVGDDLQFFVDVTYTDLSTCRIGTTCDVSLTATWTSSPAGRISVDTTGLASSPNSATTGPATITATVGTVSDISTGAIGDPVLESIDVDPATFAFPVGQTVQYTAIGHFTDGSQLDLTDQATWTSAFPAIASISDAPGTKGLATALVGGSTTFDATYQGVTGQASFTVQTGNAELDLFLQGSAFASGGTDNVGPVAAGVAFDRTFELRNTGTAALIVTGFNFTVATNCTAQLVGALPAYVAVGDSAFITIRVTPTNGGTFLTTGELLTSDAGTPSENPYLINITGSATTIQDIEVDTVGAPDIPNNSTLSAGSVPANSMFTLTVTIRNSAFASASLGVVSASTSNAMNATAAVNPALTPGSLAAGASRTFNIDVTVGNPGTWAFTVSIASNDPDENPFTFIITGTATLPVGNFLDADGIYVGSGSCGISGFDLKSDNGVTVTGFGTNPANTPFTVGGNPNQATGTNLDILGFPLHTCFLFLSGAFISLSCNNTSGGSCSGSYSKQTAPEIKVVSWALGNEIFDGGSVSRDVPLGKYARATFHVTNTGNADLVLADYVVGTTSNCSNFFVGGLPATVAAGATIDIIVEAKPAAAGAFVCPFSFTHNDPSGGESAFNITFQGMATTP